MLGRNLLEEMSTSVIAMIRVGEDHFAQFDCEDISSQCQWTSLGDTGEHYHDLTPHQIAFARLYERIGVSRFVFSVTVDLEDGRNLHELDGNEIRNLIDEIYRENYAAFAENKH